MFTLTECPCCAASTTMSTECESYVADWGDSHLKQTASIHEWFKRRILGREGNPINLTMMHCPSCDHRYNNPQLTWEELEEFYGEGYNVFDDGEDVLLTAARESVGASEFHRLPVIKGGRFLDVGCGVGDLVAAMNELGMEAEGVEPSQYAVSKATSLGRKVVCGFLHDAKYAPDSFDSISMHHVLEHTPDPVTVLRECHRVLAPGGTLTIAVPNSESMLFAWVGTMWNMLEPGHLQHFSARSLEHAGSSVGLELVRLETEALVRAIEGGLTAWVRKRFLVPQSILIKTRATVPIARAMANRANATGRGEALIARFQKPE